MVYLLGFGGNILAYWIEDLPGTAVENDIVIGPAKIEVFLDPGSTAEKILYFTNRTGKKVIFKVNVEDFAGSRDGFSNVVFMGDQKGPYSLRDYMKPDL